MSNELPNLKRFSEFETVFRISNEFRRIVCTVLQYIIFKMSALKMKRGRSSVNHKTQWNNRLWLQISESETVLKRIWNEFRIGFIHKRILESESKLPNSELYRIRIAIPSINKTNFFSIDLSEARNPKCSKRNISRECLQCAPAFSACYKLNLLTVQSLLDRSNYLETALFVKSPRGHYKRKNISAKSWQRVRYK